MLEEYLKRVFNDERPSHNAARRVAEHIVSGDVDAETAGKFLATLAREGETIPEIGGFMETIKKDRLKIDLGAPAGDVCGTGGGRRARFNTSTVVALVAAAAGCPVAKLCGGGSQAKNGSINFVEAIGCNVAGLDELLREAFRRFNLCYLDARRFLPALVHFREARKFAKCRTVINLAAPLCNPALIDYRLLGTTDKETAQILASILSTYPGLKRAWVVVGNNGVDELTVLGVSRIYVVENGRFAQTHFHPRLLGAGVRQGVPCWGNAHKNARK